MIKTESNILNIYELFGVMVKNKIIMIYQGLFDQQMIKTVMSMTEKKLGREQVGESVKKKVFNIMIEGLQNICKHQFDTTILTHNPFLVISNDDEFYHVVTGNLIDAKSIDIIQGKLDHINSLNKEQLKELYKTARLNSVISEVGGAGLGFIDMARKSENTLTYKFYPVGVSQSFFILHTKISNKQ